MARPTYTNDEILQDEEAEVINATPARQGMRGVHIMWVLIVSTLLAAAALFLAWGFRSDDLTAVNPNATASKAEAGQFNQPDPVARQN